MCHEINKNKDFHIRKKDGEEKYRPWTPPYIKRIRSEKSTGYLWLIKIKINDVSIQFVDFFLEYDT